MTGINSHENFTLSIIMDCRTPTTNAFRSKLWFKKLDLVVAKEQSGLTRIMKTFGNEKILLQHPVLS